MIHMTADLPQRIADPVTTCTNVTACTNLAACTIDLGTTRDRLVQHPLYALIDRPERLQRFMEWHVWAVWDFQSLLKALQQRLTCTSLPWLPTPDPEARRLINEIVLDEESDALPSGGYASHFELYLQSMRLAGACVQPIEQLLSALKKGVSLEPALGESQAPAAAAAFVRHTFEIIHSGSTLAILAAFTYGREDVIPDMFRNLVGSLATRDPAAWGSFRYYLQRHSPHDAWTSQAHASPGIRQDRRGMKTASSPFRLNGDSRLAATGRSGLRQQIDGLGWPRETLCIDTGDPRDNARVSRAE